MKKIMFPILLLCCLFGGYAMGQSANQLAMLETIKEYVTASNAVDDLASNSKTSVARNGPARLASVYATMVKDPRLAQYVISSKIDEYNSKRRSAQAAATGTHLANCTSADMSFFIATQNQEIILLLREIRDQRTP